MIRIPSLHERYLHRHDIPLLLVVSSALLLLGLSLPILNVEKMVLWKNSYSVFTGIVGLWEQHEYLLAAVLFFFSFVFPVAKLTVLAVVWYVRLPEARRATALRWLGLLGKWSMLDVFVVAILIVAVKLGPLAQVQPKPGIYFFCAGILGSMVTTMLVEQLARAAGGAPEQL